MAFNKSYFETIGELLKQYFGIYPCGLVTVTIKAYGQEYNLVRILKCEEDLLTFIYYSTEKSQELPDTVKDKVGENTAWPALTIPYAALVAVEFNPGKADAGKQIGFKAETKD